MSCLDTIVTLGICPDEDASLSGFRLIDAPGITVQTLAETASQTYIQGTELAMKKKALAIIQVTNDFIGALQGNKIVTSISNPEYSTSQTNKNTSVGTYAGERGLTLHKASWRGNLRQTIIKEIQAYPLSSGAATINIIDGYNTYSYDVALVANQLNVFNEANLSGFPFIINQNSNTVRITITQTNIAFASTPITCGQGCNGSIPNPCAWADGWDGVKAVKGEGYGLNVVFLCNCNYEQILCDLAKSYSGELIWLKWQINIFEEQQKTQRFNNFIVYNSETIVDTLKTLDAKYAAKWNSLMDGALGILKTYRDECLNCQGKKWVVNM